MAARDADQAELDTPQAKRATPDSTTASAVPVLQEPDQELPELVIVPFIQLDLSRSFMLIATNWREWDKRSICCDNWIDEWGGVTTTIHQMLCKELGIEDICTPSNVDFPPRSWEAEPEVWQDPYAPGGEATEPNSCWPIKPRELEFEVIEAPDCTVHVQAANCGNTCDDHSVQDHEYCAVDNENLTNAELRAYRMRCANAGIHYEQDELPRFQLRYPDDEHEHPYVFVDDNYTYLLCITMKGQPIERIRELVDNEKACALAHSIMCGEIGIPSGVRLHGMDIDQPDGHEVVGFIIYDPVNNGIAALYAFPTPRPGVNPAMELAFEALARSRDEHDNIVIPNESLKELELKASKERAKQVRIVQRPSDAAKDLK